MNSIRCSQCKHYIIANAGEGKIYGCDRSKCVFEPTTKNDLGVDCISRADAIRAMQDKAKKLTNEDTINGLCGAVAILYELPSVTSQEPTTKIEESNFSSEQYLADIQSAYDCGKSVLDRVRAEIKAASLGKWCVGRIDGKAEEVLLMADVMQIIDKHKAETEAE